MIKVSTLLIVFVAALSANPVAIAVFSEIQTSPDSLERIEFHVYAGMWAFDLSGAEIVTNAGTAIIDSGLVIYPESNYVVINRTNTTGVFSLGDDSDYVRLNFSGPTHFELRYPANPFMTSQKSWAPQVGTSASIYHWSEWRGHIQQDYYTWYIDETPTFGAPNDDTLGGIAGHVYGDSSQLVDGAAVDVTAAQGSAQLYTGYYAPQGCFAQRPTGPGRFVVTANYPGYLPYTYPATIELAPNEERNLVIHLQRPGAVEQRSSTPIEVDLRRRGRSLVLNSDRPGIALVSVCDNLGRVRMSEKVSLASGSNELALPSLSSGVYFANCRFGERTLNTKFVLY